MKKREIKKLQLNRETVKSLDQVQGGRAAGVAEGTHYESICKDLCKETEGFA